MEQTGTQPERREAAVATIAGADGFNQGAAAVRDFTGRQVRPYLAFLSIAGGFGGPGLGDMAARICVDVAEHELDPGLFEGPGEFRANGEAAVKKAFDIANSRIVDAGEQPSRLGMGATMTFVAADEQSAFVGHVGNSRGYLLTERGLRQVTSDHAEYLDSRRTRLTKALGTEDQVEADILRVPLKAGEVLFICSHALYSALDENLIGSALRAGDLQAACDYLCSESLRNGAAGDISAAAWRVPPEGGIPEAVGKAPAVGKPKKKRRIWLVALITLIILAAAAIGGWFLWTNVIDKKPAAKSTASAPAARFAQGDVLKVDGTGKTAACYLVDYPEGPEQTRLYDGWSVRVLSTRTAGSKRWYRVEVTESGQAAGKEGYVEDRFLVRVK